MTARGSACVLAMVVALAAGCKGNDPGGDAPAPAPAEPDACAAGKSDDPSRGALHAAISAFEASDYGRARELFDALVEKHPASSTLQVWRGDVALYDKALSYEESARRSLPFYAQAEKLHASGCRLRPRDQYYMRMGRAYAHLRLDEAEQAIGQLEQARRQFERSAEVHYHLARAYCLEDRVEDCARSFERTLEIAATLERPRFLRNHHSIEDWVQRSATQSEFGPLRQSVHYRQTLERVRTGKIDSESAAAER
jgi:tetratricopeptide (TPR) repeat protein